MPTIRTFNAGDPTLRPNDTAADAFAQVGRRSNAFYQQMSAEKKQAANEQGAAEAGAGRALEGVGRAIEGLSKDYEAIDNHNYYHTEAGQIAAGYTGLVAQKTQELNDFIANSNPNDTEAIPNFIENNLKPALQKFTEAPQTTLGQRDAQNKADQFLEHMSVQGGAIMAQQSADATVTNVNSVKQNLSVAVANNPTASAFYHETAEQSVESFLQSPTLTADQKAAIRKTALPEIHVEIAHAEFLSKADRNPAAAVKELLDGHYDPYINGVQKAQFQKLGEEVGRQNLAQQRANQEQADKAAVHDLAGRASQILAGTIDDQGNHVTDPNSFANARNLANLPGAKTPEGLSILRETINSLQAAKKPQANPVVQADLIGRIGNTANPTTAAQVVDAIRAGTVPADEGLGLISRVTSGNPAYKQINDSPIVVNEMNKAKAQIQGAMGGKAPDLLNPVYANATAQYKADTLRIMGDAVQRGENWQEYVTPGNPKYLFTPERAAQYTPSKDEIKKGIIARAMGQGQPASAVKPPLVINLGLKPKGQ